VRPPRRLLWSLLLLNAAVHAGYSGIGGVLVPAQVATIDDGSKVTNLALVMTLSSLAAVAVQPLVGAASDRTRSRWGRRAPWIVLGAVLAAVAMVGSAGASTIAAVAVGWVGAQAMLNVVHAPVDAVVADRVDHRRRGLAASYLSTGIALGLAGGVVLAGQLVHRVAVAYGALALAVLVIAVGFVALNPDASSADAGRARLRGYATLRGMWVSPRRHPDFARAFTGRFVLVLGHQVISGYQLYILMDYVGMGQADAGATAGVLVSAHVVCLGFGAFVAGRWSDRLGRRKVFVIGSSVLVAVGLSIPLVWATSAGMLGYAVVAGLARGVYTAVDLALMIDVLPASTDHGKDLGVLNLATVVPQLLTAPIAAVLLTLSGEDYRFLFLFAIVLVLASTWFVTRIRSVR